MSMDQSAADPRPAKRVGLIEATIIAALGAALVTACTANSPTEETRENTSTAVTSTTSALQAEISTTTESEQQRAMFEHRPETQPPDTVAIDNEGELPFYARIEPDIVYHDGEWVMVYFYRPPECIPPDFDLLGFFDWPTDDDPGALACGPPVTDGVSYWENGPEIDPTPVRVVLDGRGSVPVWFIEPSSYLAAINDGLTIGEIESLYMLKGTASELHEVLDPEVGISVSLAGALEDGREFRAHHRSGAGEAAVTFIEIVQSS